jgi:hypothetical protein
MTDMAPQKRKRGRPPTGSTAINLRFNDGLLADIDAWIELQPEPRPIRTQAIRHMVTRQLVADGIRGR